MDVSRRIDELEGQLAELTEKLEGRTSNQYSSDPRLNRLLGDPLVLSTFPHLIMVLDREMRIVYVNRAEPGLNAADYLGTDSSLSVAAEDRERYRELLKGAWSNGEQATLELRSVNGHWWDSRFVPIRDAGEVVFMLVTSTDVTKKKAQEHALREKESSARLSLLASGIGTWTWWSDRDQLIWDDALCAIFGVEPGKAARTREEYLAFVHPEDREEVKQIIVRSLRAGVFEGMAYRIVRPDGSVRHVIAKGVVQFDEQGRVEALRGGVLDVTERKELEANFAQAQRMQAVGRLTAGIAHNLNNALSIILPNVVECRELAQGTLAERLKDVEHASMRAAEMVRQLMLYARPQDNAVKRPFGLVEVSQRIVGMCRSTFDPRIQIELVPAEVPAVLGNAGQIEEVLLNICLNARDALSGSELAEPRLRIDFGTAAGNRVRVSVHDNGSGMTEAVRSRMFEPFFTTKEVGQGTGLGLSSAYAVVTDHGGTIRCTTRLGQGTRFDIELPLASVNVRPSIVPVDTAVPSGTETILLVDDESAVRRVIRRMLERNGFRVIECENGEQALAHFGSGGKPADALLIDRSMPGLSGEQVIERIEEIGIQLPILVLSGHSKVELPHPNVAAVLSKPISREVLILELRRALDQHAHAPLTARAPS